MFGKIQKLLGGRVRFVLSGSAPINSRVMTFLRIALGCEVMTYLYVCVCVYVCMYVCMYVIMYG